MCTFLLVCTEMVTEIYFYFQGWDDPYIPRTHEGLLKWKFAHMNSVDFLFEVVLSNLLVLAIALVISLFSLYIGS